MSRAEEREQAAAQAFNLRVQAWVVQHGGVAGEDFGRPSAKIATPAGELLIVANDTWIHGLFTTPALANKHFGNEARELNKWGCPNPHSGKYNFHGGREGREMAFTLFEEAMTRLLKPRS